MVICFDCDSKTKAALDELLASDQFRDYSEVISTAIANLALLRARIPRSGSAVIADAEQQLRRVDVGANAQAGVVGAVGASASTEQRVPALFRLDHLPTTPPVFGKIVIERWEREPKIPLNKWIFGQYNKLLPAKATCRALAHLLTKGKDGVPLARVATTISEEAAVLGDFLTSHNSRHGLRRDEALQTGFPRTTYSGGARVANSGQLRYASQFVAGEAGKNEVSSLPIGLKLVRCEGPDRLIQLTEPGWKFALLGNPVLDALERGASKKLSDKEIAFLLDHIALKVPVELFTYRTLLSAIAEGANTPDTLNAALSQLDIWWKNRKPEDLQSFLNSQRSGAVSRMTDLELLQRDRKGTRVTYRLTRSGEEFLKRAKSSKH